MITAATFAPLANVAVSNVANPSQASNIVVPYVATTLVVLSGLAALVVIVFLVYGGYLYISSSGKPEKLERAKKVLRNALIGLGIVLGAFVLSSLLQGAFNSPQTGSGLSSSFSPIVNDPPPKGISGLIMKAIVDLIAGMLESALRPLVDGVATFLTNTPLLSQNSAVFNFWLVTVAIADGLLALVIALLGFHVMSASALGFDEIEFKHLLPQIGLAFLVANTSIFVVDGAIVLCNTIVSAIFGSTASGGTVIAQALASSFFFSLPNVFQAAASLALVMLFLGAVFLVLVVLLLLKYISRLLILAIGVVLSPFICLMWLLPGFRDFAMNALRLYVLAIFVIIVDVVILQLANSFFTVGQGNAILSVLLGIATLATILKAPAFASQLALFSSGSGAVRKLGGMFISGVSQMSKARGTK